MPSTNSANNTLHLFKAGWKEYKQWFMGKLSQCFPIPSSCLCNPSHPQSPSGCAEAGLLHGYQEGVKWKGHLKQMSGGGKETGVKAGHATYQQPPFQCFTPWLLSDSL